MPAKKVQIRIEQGADFSLPFQLKDPDGNPVDITGCTITGSLRRSASDEEELAAFDCSVVDGSEGRGLAALTAETTSDLILDESISANRKITPAAFDIKIEFPAPNGTIFRIIEGTAEISPEVTHG